MPGITIVILLLAGGLALGVKGRAPGVSAWCAGLLVLFVCATPLGSPLPGVVSAVFSVIDGAASPVLAGEGRERETGDGAVDGDRKRPVSSTDRDNEDRDDADRDGDRGGEDGSGSGVRQVGVGR